MLRGERDGGILGPDVVARRDGAAIGEVKREVAERGTEVDQAPSRSERCERRLDRKRPIAAGSQRRRQIIDAAREFRDYNDTVAVIAALDLVVTVDTSVAHLAGAMGWPTWVLLPFACDWRWMRERVDSPWYPSLRLFRQPAPGQWDAPLAAITAALQPKRKPDSALPRTRSE